MIPTNQKMIYEHKMAFRMSIASTRNVKNTADAATDSTWLMIMAFGRLSLLIHYYLFLKNHGS
ncbi:MAG: hypothetical protein A2939_03160 [Parcubacteria group bacterium RIFCSPLOWO2_01_FULL_48_18]|nr:MAG: hypothetical protein A2939_03160 [Parcubacteria group bacterium RIFCSPLOWO2_01_FULL_48_18]